MNIGLTYISCHCCMRSGGHFKSICTGKLLWVLRLLWLKYYYRGQDKEEKEELQQQQKRQWQCEISSYCCFGFSLLGFFEACFADVKIQPSIFQQSPLFLQRTGGIQSETRDLLPRTNLAILGLYSANSTMRHLALYKKIFHRKQHKVLAHKCQGVSMATHLSPFGWR